MLSVKSDLLERFNVAINNKCTHEDNNSLFDADNDEQAKFSLGVSDKSKIREAKNSETIQKMEQRIASLELQNDQLICFINFLLDNLPDLVINILQSGNEPKVVDKLKCSLQENYNEPSSNCCQAKAAPCPTRRESDVLELLVKGFCAKEIAKSLFISESTVITHKKNLKEKFNARNTVELISKAQSHLTHRTDI